MTSLSMVMKMLFFREPSWGSGVGSPRLPGSHAIDEASKGSFHSTALVAE